MRSRVLSAHWTYVSRDGLPSRRHKRPCSFTNYFPFPILPLLLLFLFFPTVSMADLSNKRRRVCGCVRALHYGSRFNASIYDYFYSYVEKCTICSFLFFPFHLPLHLGYSYIYSSRYFWFEPHCFSYIRNVNGAQSLRNLAGNESWVRTHAQLNNVVSFILEKLTVINVPRGYCLEIIQWKQTRSRLKKSKFSTHFRSVLLIMADLDSNRMGFLSNKNAIASAADWM